ncbi:hypothetical protein [Cytobacillus dafuensis]|uniref:Uncharacterized protein n=1 Tax=Cytobacillus dafuensis TaxID=1742359 RepID=A0A5B8YZW3_CYTDA|nr:hypothetical protein [Cytobacillus dafuensis]QED46128.1 hypothetical protein FSZ17_01765 [Cytobacillus dafuensis]
MEKYYRTKHIFLAIGICIAISSPFLLVFVPQTIADIIYYTEGIGQIFVPKENYVVYGVGFLFLFLAAMLLSLLDIKKVSIILSIACVCLSAIPFFIASQSYKSISEESLSYRALFSKREYSYSWDEIERVIHYKAEDGDFPEYEFLFKDGNHVMFKANRYFQEVIPLLYYKLEEINVRIERQ